MARLRTSTVSPVAADAGAAVAGAGAGGSWGTDEGQAIRTATSATTRATRMRIDSRARCLAARAIPASARRRKGRMARPGGPIGYPSAVRRDVLPMSTAPPPAAKLPRQVPYIIGNEACERFSFYGMRNILTPFLVSTLLLDAPAADARGSPRTSSTASSSASTSSRCSAAGCRTASSASTTRCSGSR